VPTITPSRDHSLWFAHIRPEGDELIDQLDTLQPNQAAFLKIDGQEGQWRRFASDVKGNAHRAMRPYDAQAKQAWADAQQKGEAVQIELCSICDEDSESISTSVPARARAGRTNRPEAIKWTTAGCGVEGDVLCVGVDVAWWGGQEGDRSSQSECLAATARIDNEWTDLLIERIALKENPAARNNLAIANADPDAEDLATAIIGVVERFRASHRSELSVVLGLDVPLLVSDAHSQLPPPERIADRGSREMRGADAAWTLAQAPTPPTWHGFNVMPGAPIPPRVAKLAQILTERWGWTIARFPLESTPTNLVIEVFPNEVLWSAGVMGHAARLDGRTLRAYKSLGKRQITLPSDALISACTHTAMAAMRAAAIGEACSRRWLNAIIERLRGDGILDPQGSMIGVPGKPLDDCIDSFLSLMACVSFANGTAHVHQGADSSDGHIVGPGCPLVV
jgi:hypothetical protein